MRRKLAACVLLLAPLAGGCIGTPIEGSGNVVSEARQVSGFEGVALSSIFVAVLTQGDTEGLTVRADDNLMEYIVTEVRDGTLRVGLTPSAAMGGLRPSAKIEVDIAFKELSALSVSGSGSLEVGHLETDLLEVSVSGSGNLGVRELTAMEVSTSISGSGQVSIDGEARAQAVNVSGSGRYRSLELVTQAGDVSVSGSGLVALTATDRLDVRISGSGTVRYSGDPRITESISGSGKLKRVDSSGS
jgi:hypothetical protein